MNQVLAFVLLCVCVTSCLRRGDLLSSESTDQEEACRSTLTCDGSIAILCADTPSETRTDCALTNQSCSPELGCVTCSPSSLFCDGRELFQCSMDGLSQSLVKSCLEGCARGACVQLCDEAVNDLSNEGCEFWPTPIANPVNQIDFKFGVMVVNSQALPALVKISKGEQELAQRELPPGETLSWELDWIPALSNVEDVSSGIATFKSSLVQSGAYRLTSTVPVSVYQFNPLNYEQQRDCTSAQENDLIMGDMLCHSFTNDASLLLPSHSLGTHYLVTTYGSMGFSVNGDLQTTPSSFQVVAVATEPTQVSVQFSSGVMASADAQVASFQAGEVGRFTLTQGEVLQVMGAEMASCVNSTPSNPSDPSDFDVRLCGGDKANDLSGTLVTSDQPVQLFGSHPCAMVPFNVFACDHLEESLTPIHAWGRSVLVPITESLNNEPNVIRVFSSEDGNLLTFTPPVYPSSTLNKGEWVEFESSQSFRVNGSAGIQVLQFLVGQNYHGMVEGDYGDPSMSIIPPEEQYRTAYHFLAPSTYPLNFVSLVARLGQRVWLNDAELEGLVEIPGTGWASVQVPINSGVHYATSDESFGVSVYGFGTYTSYFYPGGMSVRAINQIGASQ